MFQNATNIDARNGVFNNVHGDLHLTLTNAGNFAFRPLSILILTWYRFQSRAFSLAKGE